MLIENSIVKKVCYYFVIYASLFLGFFVMAIGNVLSLRTNLGISPWNVFHTGLMNYIPITFGQASILTGAVIITISIFLGVKPYIGTFLNMIFIGVFIDIVNTWSIFDYVPDNLIIRLFLFLFSVYLLGIGSALYFSANLKYGPRDGLMMGICKKTGIRVGIVRTSLEVLIVILGWIMGGMFGIGTIIHSLTVGFFLEINLSIVKRFKRSKIFLSCYDYLHYWDTKDKHLSVENDCCHEKSIQ